MFQAYLGAARLLPCVTAHSSRSSIVTNEVECVFTCNDIVSCGQTREWAFGSSWLNGTRRYDTKDAVMPVPQMFLEIIDRIYFIELV